jgi:hypothetical protein
LDEEIADLEAELESLCGLNERSKVSLETAAGLVAEFSKQKGLSAALTDSKTEAAASERKYALVCGLSRFRPTRLSGTYLSFDFVGACPASCLAISFRLTESGQIACKAVEKPELFAKHKGKSLKAASSFFMKHIPSICSKASKSILEEGCRIGGFLRDLEWALCRLEHTASELVMLQRRYNDVKLSNEDSCGSSSLLQVEFVDRSGYALLSAKFEISRSYPFAPINVELAAYDGCVNVEGLQKYLINHAKPGFGYLSRTCDVIAAFCTNRATEMSHTHPSSERA